MKTMYAMLAGIFLLCGTALNVRAGDGIKAKALGKWDITVSQAPSGYQKYKAEIREKDGVILMDFKGGDLDIKDQKFTEKDGKLSANLYVGEYVKVLIWEDKDVIKGTADTSMGVLPVQMTKITDDKKK